MAKPSESASQTEPKPKRQRVAKPKTTIPPSKLTTSFIREMIATGINNAGGGGDLGIAKMVEKTVKRYPKLTVPMLTMITPRLVDVKETHEHSVRYQSIQEIDQELSRRGLRPVAEIFAIDYKASPAKLPTELSDNPPPCGEGIIEAEIVSDLKPVVVEEVPSKTVHKTS